MDSSSRRDIENGASGARLFRAFVIVVIGCLPSALAHAMAEPFREAST